MVNPADCGDGGKISFWLVQLHASTFLAVVDLDLDDVFFLFFSFPLKLGGVGREDLDEIGSLYWFWRGCWWDVPVQYRIGIGFLYFTCIVRE